MADIVKRNPQQQVARPMQEPHWNPWQRMRDLLTWDPFQEMTRVFGPGQEGAFIPAFEIRETNDSFVFKADLPRVKQEDVEVNVTGNRLTVSGKRETEHRDENERYYAHEVEYGSFSRSFTLPDGIDMDHVGANFKDGVLTLVLPKKAEAQPRKISLGTGSKTKA